MHGNAVIASDSRADSGIGCHQAHAATRCINDFSRGHARSRIALPHELQENRLADWAHDATCCNLRKQRAIQRRHRWIVHSLEYVVADAIPHRHVEADDRAPFQRAPRLGLLRRKRSSTLTLDFGAVTLEVGSLPVGDRPLKNRPLPISYSVIPSPTTRCISWRAHRQRASPAIRRTARPGREGIRYRIDLRSNSKKRSVFSCSAR